MFSPTSQRRQSRLSVGLILILAIGCNLINQPVLSGSSSTRLRNHLARSSSSAVQSTPAGNARDDSLTSITSRSAADPAKESLARAAYGALPLSFEANQGQADSQVKFLSHGGGYSLFLTPTEAVFSLSGHTARKTDRGSLSRSEAKLDQPSTAVTSMRMKLFGANPEPQVEGLDELPGKSNYFIGNDPEKWRTNIPSYAKVKHRDVYPGVDLIYYGNQQQLEYDFVVAPGANPDIINLSFAAVKNTRIDRRGDLLLEIAGGQIRQHKPVIYQDESGVKQYVEGRYLLRGKHRVGFEIAKYDTSKPLIIDPTFVYSTYLGDVTTLGIGIAVDVAGNAYVTGYTSTNFPTANPLQSNNAGNTDAFVTKLNATGTGLIYSTYLGGSKQDQGNGIALDAAGNAYLTGFSYSSDFPTRNPVQATNRGQSDAFVAKLNPTGAALVYSTYLGGEDDDHANGIAVDAAGNAHLVGNTYSTDFPTVNPLQSSNPVRFDGFVAKLNATGTALVYSTYLGGSNGAYGNAIAVDPAGNAYVTGHTNSTDFPTVNAFQPISIGGQSEAFVTKLNVTGTALVYSTYLGGNGADFGNGIAIDAAGSAYVTGSTDSKDFPRANPLKPFNPGATEAFVTKINATGTALVYSTYLGGDVSHSFGAAIAVDSVGDAYVTGYTKAWDFPTVNALQPQMALISDLDFYHVDAFITKLDPSGTALVYSTFLGGHGDDDGLGIAVDTAGNTYVTGITDSTDFPTANALQPTGHLGGKSFVTKIFDSTTFSVEATMANRGGNSGEVSVAILGKVFRPGVTVKLKTTNQPDIAGTSLAVINSAKMTATFDLRGAAPGSRDVVVTAPDGSTATLRDGFTIEQGGAPQPWGQIIGRNIRVGREQTYQIVIGNRGNVDMDAPLVTLSGSDASVYRLTPYSGQQPGLRIFGAGSEGSPAKLAPGATTTVTLTIQTPSSLNSDLTYRLKLFDQETSSFPWAALLAQGAPPGTRQADWAGIIAKARQRIGESWGSVLGTVRQVSAVPGAAPSNYNNFDEMLLYVVMLYGSDVGEIGATSNEQAAKVLNRSSPSLTPGDVQVKAFQTQRNPNGKDYVLTHGYGGVTDANGKATRTDFAELIKEIKRVDPTANVYLVDWSPVARPDCAIPCPRQVAPSINEVADEAYRQLKTLGAEARSITGIGESFGNDVNARIAANYGEKVDKIIALNPAFEGSGYTPPDLTQVAVTSVAFHTDSFFDTQRSMATFDVKLDPPFGVFGSWALHTYGIKWLRDRLILNEDQWLKLSIQFQKCGSPACFDGTALSDVNGTYNPAGNAFRRVINLYDILGGLLPGQDIHTRPIKVVGSSDPNDKTGPLSSSANKFIAAQQPLTYSVFFENLPSATAPAQSVTVTDQLNLANFDLQTLSLGPIAFGTKQVSPLAGIVPLAGVREFNETVDLRPANNLLVRVNAHLDTTNGRLTWTFYSVDPGTGLVTTDPLAGFLPPSGEGSVSFTVSPKANLSTGSAINNSASIVFDNNAAISTPVWSNTIDNSKPTSHVLALPATQNSASFSVQWSGTDTGSGIGDYTVYVSDNGGPFTPWLTQTAATQGTFPSTANHTYSFFSLARDLTGNIESTKTTAEATTRIVAVASIASQVTDPFGNGVNDVTMTLSGARSATAQTDDKGAASFASLPTGSYSITPAKTNYTFTPPNKTFGSLSTNQTADFIARVTSGAPILISEETSTRALALDSVSWLRDPFRLNSPVPWGVDKRTRVMLFIMNFDFQPGEDSSIVKADAEDASHRLYPLTVEYVGRAPGSFWLNSVIIRLNDDMGDLGDVLVRVTVRGVSSNRVRLGIGHNGGGPLDDFGALPTPGRRP